MNEHCVVFLYQLLLLNIYPLGISAPSPHQCNSCMENVNVLQKCKTNPVPMLCHPRLVTGAIKWNRAICVGSLWKHSLKDTKVVKTEILGEGSFFIYFFFLLYTRRNIYITVEKHQYKKKRKKKKN